jgi:NADP-dependent 3-hydroxy acid dehydrogenase YdfG
VSSPLTGRTALVTGASRGIGRAVAGALVAAGARVLGVSRSGTGHPDGVTSVALDLLAPGSIDRIVDACDGTFGGAPDILVNNAGVFAVAPIGETSPDTFDHLIALNLTIPFRLVRAFLAGMQARRQGHIVTIGSIADHVAFPGNGAYGAAKFGLRGLHEVLRGELGGSGVRATLISPAAVGTTLWDMLAPATRADFPASDQMLEAGDVAQAVLFAVTRPATVSVDELRLSRA